MRAATPARVEAASYRLGRQYAAAWLAGIAVRHPLHRVGLPAPV